MLYNKLLRIIALLKRRTDKKNFNARLWSNDILRDIATEMTGDNIVNVSGGNDSDKSGAVYRSYFCKAENYFITNFTDTNNTKDIQLNLESTLSKELVGKFDVVFSHTVLEHVFDIHKAIENICLMSKDIVITVVPFIQSFHHGEGYSDYWRFTPQTLIRVFNKNKLDTIFIKWNEDSLGNIYIVHVASKKPKKWKSIFEKNNFNVYGPGFVRSKMLSGLTKSVCLNSETNIKYSKDQNIFFVDDI